MRRWLWVLCILVPFLFFLDIVYFLQTPVLPKNNPAVIFSLEPGMSYRKVAQQLHEQQLLSRPFYWIAIAVLEKKQNKLKVGDYKIIPGEKPLDILNFMVEGKVVLYPVTIPEGWTYAQMADLISHHPYLKHTVSDYSTTMIMHQLEGEGNPEGQFFPSTYLFGRWTPDKAILLKAHKTMKQKLEEAWNARSPDVPYKNINEALIVASLIEKEAQVDPDRPMISGVIVNRINKHMCLQIDASVIYGLGERYQGKITKQDLVFDTPYNTYLHKGLPPTPICLPGQKSIYAALHPCKTVALFYVARGDGTHQFSATLQEHQHAVEKYLRRYES